MDDDSIFDTMDGLWRESAARGHAVSAEEVCRDRPELEGELEREITDRELRRLEIPEVGPWGDAAGPGASAAPMPGAEPVPGYRLVARIGGGGSGEVWAAVGPGGFGVAMKFVRLIEGAGLIESMSSESRRRARQANLRSLELMREVRHPHLLSLFGAWHRDGLLIVGMELAEKTLMDRLDEAARAGPGGIPRPELIEYMRQAARGIDHLNAPRHALLGRRGVGIQHRDVKPQNLLLVGGSVKVGDFGLAKLLEEAATLNTGSMTPAYAAPELFEGRTSASSDQYSLAVTYCHLAGRRLPFDGSPLEVMMGHHGGVPDLTMLPESERPAVARALAKRPEDRWPDCRTFVEALAEQGVSIARVPPAGRPPRLAGRRSPVRMAGTAALLSLAVVLLGVAGRDDAPGPRPAGERAVDASEAPGAGPAGRESPRPEGPGVATPGAGRPDPAVESASLETTRLSARRVGERLVEPVAALIAGARERLDRAVVERRRAAEQERRRLEERRAVAGAARAERKRAAEVELDRLEERRRAAADRDRKKAVAATPDRRTATIHVLMPSVKAELVVRGEVGKGNLDEWCGPRRVIHTPPLFGRSDYTVGTFWASKVGSPSARSRALKVEPGRVYEVDLRPDEPTCKEIVR